MWFSYKKDKIQVNSDINFRQSRGPMLFKMKARIVSVNKNEKEKH